MHPVQYAEIYRDLEHERIAELNGQLELFDEVRVVKGGNTEVVLLLLLPDPVEGLLLWVDAEWVARGLQEGGRRWPVDVHVYTCTYVVSVLGLFNIFLHDTSKMLTYMYVRGRPGTELYIHTCIYIYMYEVCAIS